MSWKEIKPPWTTLRHVRYSHPLPCDPEHKENYCIITFADGGTVAAVALTPEKEILFIEQYRPAAEQCVINLPGGRVDDKNFSPEEIIKKELKEETGYSFKIIMRVYESVLFQNPTRITDKTIIFIAQDIEEISNPQSKEMTESDSKVLAIKISEIKQLLLGKKTKITGKYLWPKNIKGTTRDVGNHEICDLTTIAALSIFCLRASD